MSLANWKPKRGTFRLELLAKRASLRAHEDAEKAAVRKRDHHRCRYPACPFTRFAVEVAHLQHKGAGGNKDGSRSVRSLMLCLCVLHHRGARSLDSGDIRIDPETEHGTDGPCLFSVSDEQVGWRTVGVN